MYASLSLTIDAIFSIRKCVWMIMVEKLYVDYWALMYIKIKVCCATYLLL